MQSLLPTHVVMPLRFVPVRLGMRIDQIHHLRAVETGVAVPARWRVFREFFVCVVSEVDDDQLAALGINDGFSAA